MMTIALPLATTGCSSDCTDSDAVGRWHQPDKSSDTWNREDMVFRSDCTCSSEEYEGNFKRDSGEYEDDAGFIEIEFDGAFDSRRGDIFGDEMELRTADGFTMVLYRE